MQLANDKTSVQKLRGDRANNLRKLYFSNNGKSLLTEKVHSNVAKVKWGYYK